jgi:hypothetical protein
MNGFQLVNPKRTRPTMAVRDGVDGYCSPRNNQQSRMRVWAISRMAYKYGNERRNGHPYDEMSELSRELPM